MAYKPFPPGTIRGPFNSRGRVTFMLQTVTGWLPFQGKSVTEEAATEKRAIAYTKKLFANSTFQLNIRKPFRA